MGCGRASPCVAMVLLRQSWWDQAVLEVWDEWQGQGDVWRAFCTSVVSQVRRWVPRCQKNTLHLSDINRGCPRGNRSNNFQAPAGTGKALWDAAEAAQNSVVVL